MELEDRDTVAGEVEVAALVDFLSSILVLVLGARGGPASARENCALAGWLCVQCFRVGDDVGKGASEHHPVCLHWGWEVGWQAGGVSAGIEW